jgi:hypothetical protein
MRFLFSVASGFERRCIKRHAKRSYHATNLGQEWSTNYKRLIYIINNYKLIFYDVLKRVGDRLCGLVVRVPGYRMEMCFL